VNYKIKNGAKEEKMGKEKGLKAKIGEALLI